MEFSSRRKVVYSLMPFVIVGGLALIAEGVLRLAAPQLRQSYFTQVDKNTGTAITGGHPLRVNRYRMREVDFRDEKPDGETRVLCLGDSITQGYGLAAESAWPKVLERLMNTQGGAKVFCMNAAGTGSTTHRQFEFYRDAAVNFDASTVVVGFCMNDVRTKGVRSDVDIAPEGRAAKSVEWRSELRRSFLFASVDVTLTEFLKRVLYPRLKGQSWIDAYPYQVACFGLTENAEEAWNDTLASLRSLKELADAHGARFVVAAFPYQFQISDDRRDNPYGFDKSTVRVDPFGRLADAARASGYEFVDLNVPFREARAAMIAGRQRWDPLYIDFCHPNELGQEIAARAIFRDLAARGIHSSATTRPE